MRKHVKEIGKFFVFVAIFFALTSPFVVLFGPFDNLKRTVVGAILKSRHPQYITWQETSWNSTIFVVARNASSMT